jgi:hypothetical protein
MKISKFLMALLLLVPFFQACQNDLTDSGDPRDAIAKQWRVTERGTSQEYDCTITKDANDITKIYISNFHNLQSTDKLYAVFDGVNFQIPDQTLDGIDNFTNASGILNNAKSITFTYSWEDGNAPAEEFIVDFGPMPSVKKKSTKANL